MKVPDQVGIPEVGVRDGNPFLDRLLAPLLVERLVVLLQQRVDGVHHIRRRQPRTVAVQPRKGAVSDLSTCARATQQVVV